MAFYITLSGGLGLTITTLFFLIWQSIDKKKNKFKITNSMNTIYIHQKDEITKWIDSLDKTLKRNNLKMNIGKVLITNILLFLISLFIGITTFKNITASIFLAMSFFVIPEYLLYLYQDFRKKKIEDQMVSAIRIFSTEFIQVRSIEKSFAAIANRIVDPVGRYFSDAYSDLLRGIPLDSVLIKLSNKVDSDYWKMFVQLVRDVNKNSTIINLFSELIAKIEVHIELTRTNQSSITGERIIALIMALSPIPVYFIMQILIPETTEFVTQNAAGRLSITVSFLSLFVFIILDRIIRKVD